jgi:hypothetical protein
MQNVVTIAGGSAHTPAAHTADNTVQYSRTFHAARHDVNDPPYERWGHPPLVHRGRSHHGVLFLSPTPSASTGGIERRPLAVVSALTNCARYELLANRFGLPWCSC